MTIDLAKEWKIMKTEATDRITGESYMIHRVFTENVFYPRRYGIFYRKSKHTEFESIVTQEYRKQIHDYPEYPYRRQKDAIRLLQRILFEKGLVDRVGKGWNVKRTYTEGAINFKENVVEIKSTTDDAFKCQRYGIFHNDKPIAKVPEDASDFVWRWKYPYFFRDKAIDEMRKYLITLGILEVKDPKELYDENGRYLATHEQVMNRL